LLAADRGLRSGQRRSRICSRCTVQSVSRREGEQIDEASGLAQAPPVLPDGERTHPYLESAEQPHPHEPGGRVM
jgi:hypothetical protein